MHGNSLPDPRGTLSNSVPSRAIAKANHEVEAEMERIRKADKKRGSCKGTQLVNGVAAAAKRCSKKFGICSSESTVRSIKQSYVGSGSKEKAA